MINIKYKSHWWEFTYRPHTNNVCIYSIQVVIDQQLFPYIYRFYCRHKYVVSFMPLKYEIGLLICFLYSCTIYKPCNILWCFFPSINIHIWSFIYIIVSYLYIIWSHFVSLHTSCKLHQPHPIFAFRSILRILQSKYKLITILIYWKKYLKLD